MAMQRTVQTVIKIAFAILPPVRPAADRRHSASVISSCHCHGAKPISTLDQIRNLVAADEVRISEHGYDEMAEDGIRVRDVVDGLAECVLVEDYPSFGKGPSVLVLEQDAKGEPIRVVWGIPRGHSSPAVVVTAYRPDPARWSDDFLERRR
ncbi:MAG: DUF4258 domain-containing protein [Gammaproteobacteria bacterium]|nr:DUF4258 domain-containing protein [Gammaproteobacteria bacterium]